jgi:hypothetical protein
MSYCNGDKYEGDWAEDKIKGKGILTYENREKLEG